MTVAFASRICSGVLPWIWNGAKVENLRFDRNWYRVISKHWYANNQNSLLITGQNQYLRAMESMRQQKFAKLIQKELSEIFLRDGAGFYGRAFVTITQVRSTPDLALAYIHLSVMGVPDAEAVVEKVNEQSHEIRKRLGMRLKHSVRHIPDVQFFLDASLDYAEKIDQLFKKIHEEEKPTE